MYVRDKWGWPIEYVKGHPIKRIIRYLIHISLWQTWKRRRQGADPYSHSRAD